MNTKTDYIHAGRVATIVEEMMDLASRELTRSVAVDVEFEARQAIEAALDRLDTLTLDEVLEDDANVEQRGEDDRYYYTPGVVNAIELSAIEYLEHGGQLLGSAGIDEVWEEYPAECWSILFDMGVDLNDFGSLDALKTAGAEYFVFDEERSIAEEVFYSVARAVVDWEV